MKKVFALFAGAALLCLAAPQAQAATFTFNDNWTDWPGFNSGDTHNDDMIGSHPSIEKMVITINDSNILQSVQVVFTDGSDSRTTWDSLFINTNMTDNGGWDHWDYFVHDGGTVNWHTDGDVPGKGLYSVNDPNDYHYTTVNDQRWRLNNPNGIDNNSLTLMDDNNNFITYLDDVLTYDLSSYNIGIAPDDFFFAYAPWCGNDVMGTPEPATMLLFGTGLIGLIGIGRKRSKRS